MNRLLTLLRSRKVQVALATILAAALAEFGVPLSEGTVLAIVATGVAVILGIAHEDAGRGGPSPGAPAADPPR